MIKAIAVDMDGTFIYLKAIVVGLVKNISMRSV